MLIEEKKPGGKWVKSSRSKFVEAAKREQLDVVVQIMMLATFKKHTLGNTEFRVLIGKR